MKRLLALLPFFPTLAFGAGFNGDGFSSRGFFQYTLGAL